MASADGEASASVAAHVQACSACSAQVGGYARTQSMLRRSLYRVDCPDAHTLGEYHLDLLEPEQRMRLADHVMGCAACGVDLHTLRNYLALPTVMPESPLARSRRMVALLLRPASGLAFGGLRGNAETTTRVYQVEDVTVTAAPGQGAGTLVGLVVIAGTDPQALDGRSVRLVPSSRIPLTSAVDDLGNFEFEGVPAGLYALELDLPNALVVVEELRVD